VTAIGQMLGESLGLGGTVVALSSLAFVGYAIRSFAEEEVLERVRSTDRSTTGRSPATPAEQKVFRNP